MGRGYEQNNETKRPPKPGVSLVSGFLLGFGCLEPLCLGLGLGGPLLGQALQFSNRYFPEDL